MKVGSSSTATEQPEHRGHHRFEESRRKARRTSFRRHGHDDLRINRFCSGIGGRSPRHPLTQPVCSRSTRSPRDLPVLYARHTAYSLGWPCLSHVEVGTGVPCPSTILPSLKGSSSLSDMSQLIEMPASHCPSLGSIAARTRLARGRQTCAPGCTSAPLIKHVTRKRKVVFSFLH